MVSPRGKDPPIGQVQCRERTPPPCPPRGSYLAWGAISKNGASMAGSGLDIRGIIVPTLTPFDRSGAIDYVALAREIDYIADVCQPGAIALAGTEDSEYTMLSWADRIELIRRGSAMARGRTPLIVGISHPATERGLELAALAKEVGADAVQVLLPIRL